MNREDITRWATQCKMPYDYVTGEIVQIEKLESFAALVAAAEREACGRVKAERPRKLKPVGRGMLLDEQQFCFDKGWREGAASVRAAIRARGQA